MGMRQRCKQGSHIGNYCNNPDEMIMAWTRRVSGKGEKRSGREDSQGSAVEGEREHGPAFRKTVTRHLFPPQIQPAFPGQVWRGERRPPQVQAGQCREVRRRPGASRLQITAVKGARERSGMCWGSRTGVSSSQGFRV